MRGRKPKTGTVRRAQGNPGHRKIAPEPAEPKGAPVASLPFVELSVTARLAYDIIGADLRRLNFVRSSDEPLLLRYCDALARFWRVTAELDRLGSETYETTSAHGNMLRMRPQFMVQERLARRLESMEDRLGLSPMARQQYLRAMAAAGAQPQFWPDKKEPQPRDEAPTAAPAPPLASPIGLLKHALN